MPRIINRTPPRNIEVTVNGVTYNTIRDAWRALSPDDLPEITVRKRLAAGWATDIAFLTSPIIAEQRRLGRPETLIIVV